VSETKPRRAIVYVHGLWLTGHESTWLRSELAERLQAQLQVFKYSSMGEAVAANAVALRQFLRAVQADELHIVAHSLGGIVVLKCFEEDFELPPGRIVFLGSPVQGSDSARTLARLPFGPTLMGRAVDEELLATRERRWHGRRDLGVIAGDMSFGLGKLLGQMAAPNDGTIQVAETQLPGAQDRVILHVSHTGMLFSAQVALQVAAFLRDGKFVR
jgi:pimeloyl-ACP methyl ester carboxylesterase